MASANSCSSFVRSFPLPGHRNSPVAVCLWDERPKQVRLTAAVVWEDAMFSAVASFPAFAAVDALVDSFSGNGDQSRAYLNQPNSDSLILWFAPPTGAITLLKRIVLPLPVISAPPRKPLIYISYNWHEKGASSAPFPIKEKTYVLIPPFQGFFDAVEGRWYSLSGSIRLVTASSLEFVSLIVHNELGEQLFVGEIGENCRIFNGIQHWQASLTGRVKAGLFLYSHNESGERMYHYHNAFCVQEL